MKVLSITLGLIWTAQLSIATTEKCSKEENKTYYIYSQVNIKVYYCIETNGSCADVGVGETFFDNHFAMECLSKLYGVADTRIYQTPKGYTYDFAPNGKKKFTTCVNEGQFEFHIDKNKYPVSTAFWTPYSYKHLELIYTGTWSERVINSKTYITSSSDNYVVALALEQQLSLSGRSFWTTNIPGILASDEYIEGLIEDSSKLDQYQKEFRKVHASIQSECEVAITEHRTGTGTSEIDTRLPCPEEMIAALRAQLYCIIFVVIICALWLCISSAVDMYTNFLTLRRAAKKLPKGSRMYLINCVSQSLTNRWLFLNKNPGWDEGGIPLDVTRDADNHNLYESVH